MSGKKITFANVALHSEFFHSGERYIRCNGRTAMKTDGTVVKFPDWTMVNVKK